MSPHIVQSVAKAQMDDFLRSAERRRLAAQVASRPPTSSSRPRGQRLGLRSLRAVFG